MQTIVWSTLYVQFFSPVQDGDRLEFGGLKFRTMLTQGHTTGHMVYILDGSPYGVPDSVFSGDLLFLAGCGQCWGHCGHAMAPSFFLSFSLSFLLSFFSFFFILFSFFSSLFLLDFIINLKIHAINNVMGWWSVEGQDTGSGVSKNGDHSRQRRQTGCILQQQTIFPHTQNPHSHA